MNPTAVVSKAHHSRNSELCGTGPTVDFKRYMVMKSKKEDLLSNKDKQRFIRMLGQSLEHVGCETRHAKGDADVRIVETSGHTAMS